MRRLYHIGINDKTWSLIHSLHENASSAIKWQGNISDLFHINQGVRQGGILSADLYKVYVNPLLERLNNAGIGSKIGDIICNTSACADDVTINASNMNDAQVLVSIAQNFAYEERYQLQASKTNVIHIKTSKNQYTLDNIIEMNDTEIPNVETAAHIGLQQSSNLNKFGEINVENNIKKARRATYSLMPAGLHGENGLDPETSLQLIRTYILPILLYGLEIIIPNRTQITKLELFQKKLLKQILSVPPNTSDAAIYLLTGFLPIEAQIHKKALQFFNNITNQGEESIEFKLAKRQLSIKSNSSASWFMDVKKLLLKYNLQDPMQLLEQPVPKHIWKSNVNKLVDQFWINDIKDNSKMYKSLNFLNIRPSKPGRVHPLLKINCKSTRDINRIPTKLRLLTGTYILQCNRSKFKNSNIDSTCLLCNNDAETPEHFILLCDNTAEVRDPVIKEISRIIKSDFNIIFKDLSNQEKLQVILDCTVLNSKYKDHNKLAKLEFQNRRLLHNLHIYRYKAISIK